jgi:hypothetical protein
MSDLPSEMLKNGRPEDQEFESGEFLYRRVPEDLWDDDEIDLDSIELPDMSVNREKYGPAWWVRYMESKDSKSGAREFVLTDWGVIGFRVEDVPPEQAFHGQFLYKFKVAHAPNKYNYAHSEVRAFETIMGNPKSDEIHIKGNDLINRIDPIWHLRWREKLARKCERILSPGEPNPEG